MELRVFWIRNKWWLSPTLSAVGTAIVSIGGTVWLMLSFVTSDLPDLKQNVKDAIAEVRAFRSEIAAVDTRQRQELSQHVSQEQDAREKIENSLKALRVHVIALVQRVEKRPLRVDELNQLLSSVENISNVEALKFDKFTLTSGNLFPKIPAGIASFIKAGMLKPELAQAFEMPAGGPFEGEDISKYLVRSLVTKGSTWKAVKNGLIFKHELGTGVFTYNKVVSMEDIKRHADFFNSLSNVGEAFETPIDVFKKKEKNDLTK